MITFKEFLYEGGWSNTATQGVKLTPAVAKKAVTILPRFEKDFNAFLSQSETPPIKIGKPVGSTAYIERDLENNPTKEYGDIDVMMHVPKFGDYTDSKLTKHYSDSLKKFVASENLPYLLKDHENGGKNIIVKVGSDWVQVDLIMAIGDLADWATHRSTPEHGLKGALLGTLYAALAEVLNLSIGSNGVQAKEKNGELVSFRELKDTKLHTMSKDIGNFALDILDTFANRDGIKVPVVAPLLKAHPGINRENVKAVDLADAIMGLGHSFELNHMFGQGDLKHVSDYSDFISQVKRSYTSKMESAAKSTKFDKAGTPEAKQKALDTKDLLLNKSKEVVNLLN